MGSRAIAAALVGALAFAPWLVLLPLGGAAAVLASAIALVAACHGAGQLVAWLSGLHRNAGRLPACSLEPLLAIQLGLAAMIGLAGLASALHLFTLAGQIIVVYGFAAVHTAVVVLGRAGLRDAPRTWLRPWLVPCLLLGAIAVLHVLGAAGDLGARPFDDDGHVLAQLQRLRETGTLGDPIGYPRTSQLGGQLAFDALACLAGDIHLARAAEALAFALAIALVCARIGPRALAGAIWALLVVVAASALAFVPADAATCWTAVGLVIALHALVTDRLRDGDHRLRSLVPLGVVAGALITLRFELAPMAAIAGIAVWSGADHARARLHRFAVIAAVVLAVVAPYAAIRALAWSEVPAAARGLIAAPAGALGPRLAIAAATLVAALPLVALARRDLPARGLAIGACLAIAGMVGQLTGARPYAIRFLWPLALAIGLIAIIEIARRSRLTTAALVGTLVLAVLVYEGRDAAGRVRWTRRYLDLATHIEYLRHARERPPASGDYEALLRRVPPGATVAAWVARPEQLDYAGPRRLVDLRTPRIARLRSHRWDAHASRIEKLLGLLHADYLLVEADDRRAARSRADLTYRLACGQPLPGCADDLESIALRHPVIAERAGIQLVQLGPDHGAGAAPDRRAPK